MAETHSTVSIVIPAYRAEAFIARAIQSVLDQPGIDPEIIVVVDGLVDRTADIAEGFPKTRVVINEVNRGASAARNRGLALAQAPYVMFLDADDWVEGPFLQGLIEALDLFQADIAFGRREKRYESEQPAEIISFHAGGDEKPFMINNKDLIIAFMTCSYIEPCATMWRSAYIREQDGWNESLISFEDFELVHRCLIRGAKAALTGKGCGVYYQYVSEHRLTLGKSKAYWQSLLTGLALIVDEAKSSGLHDRLIMKAFIDRAGHHMRTFARDADWDSYHEAKKFFKVLGGTRLHGTLAHRLGCFFLGLRIKEQLGLRARRMKSFLVKR